MNDDGEDAEFKWIKSHINLNLCNKIFGMLI